MSERWFAQTCIVEEEAVRVLLIVFGPVGAIRDIVEVPGSGENSFVAFPQYAVHCVLPLIVPTLPHIQDQLICGLKQTRIIQIYSNIKSIQ